MTFSDGIETRLSSLQRLFNFDYRVLFTRGIRDPLPSLLGEFLKPYISEPVPKTLKIPPSDFKQPQQIFTGYLEKLFNHLNPPALGDF
jgi:hypothetical protein